MDKLLVGLFASILLGCQHLDSRSKVQESLYEKIQISSGELNSIDAYVFKPPGKGPFPAIVGLHGCAGLFKKDGRLNPREMEWGKYLANNGFVVVYPDSFTSRSIDEICTRTDMVDMARKIRPTDSYSALRWLQKQSFVDASRTALIGWSNGGSSLLWAISKKPNFLPVDLVSDFKIALAIYPGCRSALSSKPWSNRIPLEMHIGEADDWAPPEQCQSLLQKSKLNTARIILYPDAHHDFDAPNLPIMIKKNLAYPAKHGNFATIGTHQKARGDLMQNILLKLKTMEF